MTGHYLLDLPDECLSLILSMLRPSQLRRLALTFNHQLFRLTSPLLEPLNQIRKNEAYLESLWRLISPEPLGLPDDIFELLNLTNQSVSQPLRPSNHLEFLDLNGDLSWLEKRVNQDLVHRTVIRFTEPFRLNDLSNLIHTTSQLGLTLPASLHKLLQSQSLVNTIFDPMIVDLTVSQLFKIRKYALDEDLADESQFEEGYMFILGNNNVRVFCSIYLDTAGRHAILNPVSDTVDNNNQGSNEHASTSKFMLSLGSSGPDLSEAEEKLGVLSLPHFMPARLGLADIDFERFLVHYYYTERIRVLTQANDMMSRTDQEELKSESVLFPDHVKEYLYNVYTERGRAMQ